MEKFSFSKDFWNVSRRRIKQKMQSVPYSSNLRQGSTRQSKFQLNIYNNDHIGSNVSCQSRVQSPYDCKRKSENSLFPNLNKCFFIPDEKIMSDDGDDISDDGNDISDDDGTNNISENDNICNKLKKIFIKHQLSDRAIKDILSVMNRRAECMHKISSTIKLKRNKKV